MKQTMNATKMITMGLFTLCTMGLSQATFANAKADNPEEFKFIGNTNNNPVFQLSLNNDEAGSYFINIKDENGNVLYSEKISGVNLSRKYQLDIDEAESNDPGFELRVEVTSENTHKTEVYKVSSNVSVVKNFAVVKL